MIVFNGVIAGAVGAYVTTGSAMVALLAALLAVALAAWLVLLDR